MFMDFERHYNFVNCVVIQAGIVKLPFSFCLEELLVFEARVCFQISGISQQLESSQFL